MLNMIQKMDVVEGLELPISWDEIKKSITKLAKKTITKLCTT